jgi:hypothetical protein
VTYFFDNCLAKPLAVGIGVIFETEVRVLEQEFGRTNVPDLEWMPVVAKNEWIVITGDDHIRKSRSERALLKSLRLRTVFIAPGFICLPFAIQAGKLVTWWSEIDKRCQRLEFGTCLLVSMNGKVELLEKL